MEMTPSDTSNEGQYWYVERRVPEYDKQLTSSATYTSNGAFVDTVTDQRGIVTKYDYDQNKRLLNSVTTNYGAADDRTVNYTYNANKDLLTKVSQGTVANEYLYDSLQRLSGIQHNGFQYSFGYDSFGNRITTKVGSRLLSQNSYNGNNGKLTKSTYGNGAELLFKYDRLNRLTENWWNGSKAFTWTYNNAGQVGRHEDLLNGVTTTYEYDTIGRLMNWRNSSGYEARYAYDLNNNLTEYGYTAFGIPMRYSYSYGKDDRLESTSWNRAGKISYTYDPLNRPTGKQIQSMSSPLAEYTYVDGSGSNTTTLLESISGPGYDYSYTYDSYGNIRTISENGTLKVTYTYDEWNQLIKEEHSGGDTIEYTYDGGGNLLTKKVNGTVSQTYTYGDSEWKDLLTGFNGQTITYDAIGNPLSYHNGEGYTFTWKNGRQLSTLQKGSTGVSYSYNADVLRVSKTVNGVKTEYAWDGNRLMAQKGSKRLEFLYDGNGLYGLTYGTATYYYVYNGQGDVVGLADYQGNQVVSYTYDAWGKPLTITGPQAAGIGELNPFRYRGYYYDAESGLYYLQSRYYDPVVGRFLNVDGVLGV